MALVHHLVSQYTSLVAIDPLRSRPAIDPLMGREVPTALPAGWDPSFANTSSGQFFADVIECSAEMPLIDTSSTSSATVFDEDFLRKAVVGIGSRDYLDLACQNAAVSPSNPHRGARPGVRSLGVTVGQTGATVMGSGTLDNAYLVDGVNSSDPLLGTFGVNFNYDAIQEVTLQASGFDAEFGDALGGVVNLNHACNGERGVRRAKLGEGGRDDVR